MNDNNIFNDPEVLKQLKISTISMDTPIYIEVYRRIRRLIKQNVLKYGQQFPGELELASLMGVGRTSLRMALSILYEDGYIKILRGKGSYVCYDDRAEKYQRRSPVGILFPTERIELLGELSKNKPVIRAVSEDEYLSEKFSHQPPQNIMLFTRLYNLDGKSAIYSYYYFLSDFIGYEKSLDGDSVESRIITELHNHAVTAEYECLPVQASTIKEMEMHPKFAGESHILVTTTYLNKDNDVIGYCKDYYNNEVIRFTMGLKRQNIL